MTQTVLITGASGFVATHVIRAFLEAGYNVRGTVRSEQTAANARKAHAQFGDKLTFSIVPDIAAKGAFNEAVKGVDGVIHTASPFILGATDYEKDLFTPAINGTTSILSAVQEHNPSVKHVVITSSFASVLDPVQGLRPGYNYTEADWNPVTKETASANGVIAYLASKTFAEHAAFDFVKDQKPNFSIATVCPPMVYGPAIHHIKSMKDLNTSSSDIYRLINGSETQVPDTSFWAFTDVRDLAQAHLLAYQSPRAANQRYLIAASAYSYQQVCDIIRDKFPQLRERTPQGETGAALPAVYRVDTRKAVEELGMSFTPLEKTVVDTVERLLALEGGGGGAC